MTKYILAGGYSWKAEDGGKSFCQEMVEGFTGPVRILICVFARSEETWHAKLLEDTEFFTTNLPDQKLEFQLANREHFIEQVQWADAIFLRGGDSQLLLHELQNQNGWQENLAGKTVAGSSAGADVLVKYTYNLDTLQIEKGLGLVETKVLVHYLSDYNSPHIDWKKAEQELSTYKETLPLFKLREGEFQVINV